MCSGEGPKPCTQVKGPAKKSAQLEKEPQGGPHSHEEIKMTTDEGTSQRKTVSHNGAYYQTLMCTIAW